MIEYKGYKKPEKFVAYESPKEVQLGEKVTYSKGLFGVITKKPYKAKNWVYVNVLTEEGIEAAFPFSFVWKVVE
jgi:ASC-1-like (ASCH) protein